MKVADTSLAEQAYRRIRQGLSDGSLGGDGRRLSINGMAKQLGMSRTPVRDAVQQLANEGLLQSVARSGVVLCGLSYEDLVEMNELRQALDPYAAARAAERMDYVQKRRLRSICREMARVSRQVLDGGFADQAANRRLHRLDMDFHELIMEGIGNRRMRKVVEDYHLLAGKARYPSVLTAAHLARTLCEHWRVCRAIEAGQSEQARLWMERHTIRGGQATLAAYRDSNSDPFRSS